MQAMQNSKACDRTGIGACACGRHGCFAPNAIGDFFKGEQQKNIDWVLLQHILGTNIHPKQRVVSIYDIGCLYGLYLQWRLEGKLPDGMEFDHAIGLFHVHGHKDECFWRFATTFIVHCGIISGEILESLWAELNAISPTARTATLAHRAEILDDHATDSNYRKMLGIGTSKSHMYACFQSLMPGDQSGPLPACTDRRTKWYRCLIPTLQTSRWMQVRTMWRHGREKYLLQKGFDTAMYPKWTLWRPAQPMPITSR